MQHNPPPTVDTAKQPTRAGEANDAVAVSAEEHTDTPLLPSLDRGLTLLDIEDGRGVSVLQSLVLDHLLTNDGPAFWIDTNGHATSTAMSRLAPSQRLLDRIHLARAFTAPQHFDALTNLPGTINETIRSLANEDLVARHERRARRPDRSPDDTPQTPSLVVVPALDGQYRQADGLASAHAETLQARAIARLRSIASAYGVPVLVTRTACCSFTEPIETAADTHLEVEQTEFGPRFVGDEFETLLYPVGDGAYQTTLAYWQRQLQAQAKQVGLTPNESQVPESQSRSEPWTTTEPAPLTASPLLGPGGAGPHGGV